MYSRFSTRVLQETGLWEEVMMGDESYIFQSTQKRNEKEKKKKKKNHYEAKKNQTPTKLELRTRVGLLLHLTVMTKIY